MKALQLRWFDYWLKGVDNGIMDAAPVRVFVMGDNAWREEQTWPLERTEYTKFYIHSQGKASASDEGTLSIKKPRRENPDVYIYDPNDPVPTKGGNMLGGGGPYDQSAQRARQDVLTYQTAVLADDIEVTGPVKMMLVCRHIRQRYRLYGQAHGCTPGWKSL